MRNVILESPYAGNVGVNQRYARACIRDSLMRGESPIASHLLYTQEGILDDNNPSERQLGIEAGLSWIIGSEASVVYSDLGISAGMKQGISLAHEFEVPVEYRTIGFRWAENPGTRFTISQLWRSQGRLPSLWVEEFASECWADLQLSEDQWSVHTKVRPGDASEVSLISEFTGIRISVADVLFERVASLISGRCLGDVEELGRQISVA